MTPVALRSTVIGGRHGFFTRLGGVSEGPYASLNASFGGGDDAERVRENRARVAAALGVDRVLGLKQVHGTRVITVSEPWPEGGGPEADAMVSRVAALALGVITADCAPVLLRDAAAGVAGAAHAGWRGAAAGVLETTVAAMRALGATAIVAAIGPCIGPASYEVGEDLVAAIPDGAAFMRPGRREGRWQFDLPGYAAARLAGVGVKAVPLAFDTYADETRFFSHRRRTHRGEPAIGHQLSAIVV